MKQTKGIHHLILFIFFTSLSTQSFGQSTSILRQSTGMGGSSSSIIIDGNNYLIQQSIGQSSVIGTFNNHNNVVRQGFLQANTFSLRPQLSNDLIVNVFPNPFHSIINIQLEDKNESFFHFFIYDISGRLIYHEESPLIANLSLDFTFLQAGTYLIKITSNTKTYSAQIQKI